MTIRIEGGRPTIVVADEDSRDDALELKRVVLAVGVLAVVGSVLVGPLLGFLVVGAVIAALAFLLQVETDESRAIEPIVGESTVAETDADG